MESSKAKKSMPQPLTYQIGARELAGTIRQIEMMLPGYFGDAASVIRRLAAGDDVAPADLSAALASVRSTLHQAAVIYGVDPHLNQNNHDTILNRNGDGGGSP